VLAAVAVGVFSLVLVGCLPPSNPTGLQATSGSGTVQLSWTAPPDGNPTGYVVAYWRVDEPGTLGAQIVGGVEVSTSTYPWTAALLYSSVSDPFNAQFCGGSLVDPSWVLTAAHCVTDPTLAPNQVQVALGHDNLSSITPGDRIAVDQIVVRPDYDSVATKNDAALLHLAGPATTRTPVLLAHDPAHTPAGAGATIIGWGSTKENGGYPDHLRGANVTIVSAPGDPVCGNYGSAYQAASMLCAGVSGGGVDTCYGDSGGPLVVKPSVYELAGITSWGNGCGRKSYPGIYTRVTTYASWVDQYLGDPPELLTGITQTSRTVSGLASGGTYLFAVAAVNGAGTGPFGTPIVATAT
jgi:secreted trypsin-like serine protease